MIPTSAAVAADATSTIAPATSAANNVLDLGFDGNLTDNSAVKNTVTAYKGTPTYVDGVDGQAVKLDAGALALGASQKLQPEDLSLSFWWNPTKTMTGEQILMWGKGKYNENGWYLSSNSDDRPLVFSIGAGSAESSGQPLAFILTGARANIFPVNTWTHVMVTFDAATKTAKFYINGEAKASTTENPSAPGAIVADGTAKYIGWNGTHASGGQLTGSLDDVKLWDAVATTADVEREVKVGKPDFDATTLAQAALDNVNLASKATSNLTFNAESANGATLTYESSDTSVIANDGTVTRPAVGSKDATVTIKVTSSYGSKAVTKDVTVTVPAQTENGGSDDVEYLKNYLSEQGMNNVVVSDEYLQNAGQKEIGYLLSFEPDRLIVEFRATAGVPYKEGTKNYGGWESGPDASRNPDGSSTPVRFTGHFVGHWISAASQAQRSTFATADQKKQLATKLKEVVTGIREAQQAYAKKDAANAGFLPAFTVDVVPHGGNDLIVPFYDLHKVEQGLVHAYDYASDTETREAAKVAAVDFAKWVVNWNAAHPGNNMLATEYGGMNDALYQTAQIADAGDKQTVLTAAHLFDETALFQKLADGQDPLNGLHANTTIPKFVGAMQRYVTYKEDQNLYNSLSKDEQGKLDTLYLKAAQNFWTIVLRDRTYVNGGNSQAEHFHVAGELWKDATQNGDQNGVYNDSSTVETCNEYNMLKLTRLLFQVTKDAKYSEYYEHTFINAIVASQNPETGMTTYFQPMKAGYPKIFGVSGTDYDKAWFGDEIGGFWCCQGTGIESLSKLNDSFYFTDANDIYVNMFWSSTYTDARHGLTITQTANVPKQDKVTFEVSGTGSANLKLRLPEWAIASKVTLTVDGTKQDLTKDGNGWLTVKDIKDGTKIEYTLPARLQAIGAADNKNWVAFQYGPVVLAGALTGTDYKTNSTPVGAAKVHVANYDAAANDKAMIIPTNKRSVSDWLKGISEDGSTGNLVRTDDPKSGNRETLSFAFKNVNGDAAGLKLQPYYSTYKTTYAIYWDLTTVDSTFYQQKIIDRKDNEATNDLVADAVTAFDYEFQQELQHNAAKSDDSNAGTYQGKQYRDAQKGGWFSYDLSVKQGQDNYLAVQYAEADNWRDFDVFVDPTPVTDRLTGALSANAVAMPRIKGTGTFYWDSQKLPADLVAKAKDGKVRVMFKSSGSWVGGVYGVRIQNGKWFSADATLQSLKFSKGTLSPAFSANKDTYTLTVPAGIDTVNATFTVNKPGAYVKVDGIAIDDTKARAVPLGAKGDTTALSIDSVAQDHTTTRHYTVWIVRQPQPTTPPVTKVAAIAISGTSTLTVGDSTTLTALVLPKDTKNKSVSWLSSDSTVATVDGSGKVSARKAGTAKITATAKDGSGTSGSLIVTVKASEPGNGGSDKPAEPNKPGKPETPDQETKTRFTDVGTDTPHEADINWLSDQGIANGYLNEDGRTYSFGGMRTVVRQDMAAFLYRLAGSPAFDASKARNPFKDVNGNTPHYKEILWLYSTGIAKGYVAKDGTVTFGGMRTVVRQDMAAFLHRYASWAKANPKLGKAAAFTDVTAGTPHAADIAWLSRTNVTTGFKDGTFGGMRSVVRQDMAAFLHRMNANVLK